MKAAQIVEPLREFYGTLVRPEKEFEDLSARPHWFVSYLYLCAGKTVVEYFHSLIGLRVMTSDVFSTLDPDKMQRALRFLRITSYVSLALTPAAVIVRNLVTAALFYWLISLIKERVEFRKILSVTIHCWLIVLIAGYFNLLILVMKGYKNLVHLEDLNVNLGLDIVLRGSENVVLKAVFESITVFSLWHLVLLIIGVSIVAQVSKRSATVAALFVWALTVAFKVGQSIWNQNVGKMMG